MRALAVICDVPSDIAYFLVRMISNRRGLSPLLFNFALEYAIRWVHVKQDALK